MTRKPLRARSTSKGGMSHWPAQCPSPVRFPVCQSSDAGVHLPSALSQIIMGILATTEAWVSDTREGWR